MADVLQLPDVHSLAESVAVTIHRTFCALRLGDNLAHLLLLRRLAKLHPDRIFEHHCRRDYYAGLVDVVEDLPNIRLELLPDGCPWDYQLPDAVNVWKGHGDHWYRSELKADYVAYYLQWYRLCCKRMGFDDSPIKSAGDFLFDYPALITPSPLSKALHDFLIVNDRPMSNQWAGYDEQRMAALAETLSGAGYAVNVTSPGMQHMSPTKIGQLSIAAKYIIMVATGTSWTTFNTANRDTVALRIILIDSETIAIDPNTLHADSVERARSILVNRGLL